METDKSTVSQEKIGNGGICTGVDYQRYRLNFVEEIVVFMKTLCLSFAVAVLFYDSFWAMGIALPLYPLVHKREVQNKLSKRTKKLQEEFKEAMLFIASSIQIGHSVENAFVEVQKEMLQMTGSTGIFYKELNRMNGQVKMNVSIEQAYEEFSKRSGLEEAVRFGEIFMFSKRAGGDYGQNIRKTALRIQQKMEVEQEIATIMTEKQLEMKIMSIMPIGILGYIYLSSKEFISPLYHNMFGIIVMSICIAIYILAIYLGKRIVEVRI